MLNKSLGSRITTFSRDSKRSAPRAKQPCVTSTACQGVWLAESSVNGNGSRPYSLAGASGWFRYRSHRDEFLGSPVPRGRGQVRTTPPKRPMLPVEAPPRARPRACAHGSDQWLRQASGYVELPRLRRAPPTYVGIAAKRGCEPYVRLGQSFVRAGRPSRHSRRPFVCWSGPSIPGGQQPAGKFRR